MAQPNNSTSQEPEQVRGRERRRKVVANGGGSFRDALDDFYEMRALAASRDDPDRIRTQPKVVSRFFDVVTRFYEIGWGQSFHFSPRHPGESLRQSQKRHEDGIAALLGLRPGIAVADIGCGIGGPLVNVAQTTGARVTGINFNAYQIERGQRLVRREGLEKTCSFLLANFMDVPLPDGSFDAMYSFEAICHAPNTRLCFGELYRLLKAGGEIAIVDWCLTGRFDEDDKRHRDIRDRIESTNATPGLMTDERYVEAAKSAGFEVLKAVDQQATDGDSRTPWYMALQGKDLSLSSIARIPAGRRFTATMLRALERARLVPAGSAETAEFLNVAADALVEAGELGIFTPSFLVHARKPASR